MPEAVTRGSLKPLTPSSMFGTVLEGEADRCEFGVEGRLASWFVGAKWPFCRVGRARAFGGNVVFFGLKRGSSTRFFFKRGAPLTGCWMEGVDVAGRGFMVRMSAMQQIVLLTNCEACGNCAWLMYWKMSTTKNEGQATRCRGSKARERPTLTRSDQPRYLTRQNLGAKPRTFRTNHSRINQEPCLKQQTTSKHRLKTKFVQSR